MKVKASKIVAGQEVERTNEFLQLLSIAILKKVCTIQRFTAVTTTTTYIYNYITTTTYIYNYITTTTYIYNCITRHFKVNIAYTSS